VSSQADIRLSDFQRQLFVRKPVDKPDVVDSQTLRKTLNLIMFQAITDDDKLYLFLFTQSVGSLNDVFGSVQRQKSRTVKNPQITVLPINCSWIKERLIGPDKHSVKLILRNTEGFCEKIDVRFGIQHNPVCLCAGIPVKPVEKLPGQRIRLEPSPVETHRVIGGEEGVKDYRFIGKHPNNWNERLPQKADKYTIEVFIFP
jgi:hypothetical protein